MVVPTLDNEVCVLYFLTQGTELRQMERRRYSPIGVVAVPAPETPQARQGLRLGPNPLRAGASLSLRLDRTTAAPGSVLEIFDLAGRRVASAPLVADGTVLSVEVSGSVTRGWESGVYFARVLGADLDGARLVVLR
jgi:hypothetical protein